MLISQVQEHCRCFEWIDPPTCVHEIEIAAKIIEKSNKLENYVVIVHEREVVARGMDARVMEKEMIARNKEKMYTHALVVSWSLIVVVFMFFWYFGQVGKMKKTLSLPWLPAVVFVLFIYLFFCGVICWWLPNVLWVDNFCN